jgi:hypothetical protein
MKNPCIIYQPSEYDNIIIRIFAEEYADRAENKISELQEQSIDCFMIEMSAIPQYIFDYQEAFLFNSKDKTVENLLINFEKAKQLVKDKWRIARGPLLEKLDVEYMKALEQGNTELQASIVNQKQQLRDITNLEMPNDFQVIIHTWPEILNS